MGRSSTGHLPAQAGLGHPCPGDGVGLSGGVAHQDDVPLASVLRRAVAGNQPSTVADDGRRPDLQSVQKVRQGLFGARPAAAAHPHAHVGHPAFGEEPAVAANVEGIEVDLGGLHRSLQTHLALGGKQHLPLGLPHPASHG